MLRFNLLGNCHNIFLWSTEFATNCLAICHHSLALGSSRNQILKKKTVKNAKPLLFQVLRIRWKTAAQTSSHVATCSHLQPLATTCRHLHKQPLAATCSHLQPIGQVATYSYLQLLVKQPLAATSSHKQPPAATSSHLPKQPQAATSSHKQPLAQAATCSYKQPLAATSSHLQLQAATCNPLQPLAATCSPLQPLAASLIFCSNSQGTTRQVLIFCSKS